MEAKDLIEKIVGTGVGPLRTRETVVCYFYSTCDESREGECCM